MSLIPEIVPGDFPFPDGARGKIYDAVLRIATSRDGWHGPVESVRIRRVIGGGRSGALVLDVVLRSGSERRQRVVKIGPPAEMAGEFANFRRFLGDYPAAVCAPIQEVTDGAGGDGEPAGETEAVVYAHVEDYAGRSEVPAITLEDVVGTAFDGGADELVLAQELIMALFAAMATPFHNRQVVRAERSLRDLNPALGPDLVVEPGPVTAQLSYPEDVLQSSLGGEGFTPGSPIRLADPAHSAVRVVQRPPGEGPIAGTVVTTRFADRRARFDQAFERVERVGGAVVADGTRTADPARGLLRVLTDPELGRVRGVVHGDLNARNVMCVDGRPVLIDFARTTDEHPVFADAAWLETSLIRDVFAELPYNELVRVQRLLALAARLHEPEADERLADLLEGRAQVAFRIMAKIRSSAARSYPPDVVAWRDYLAQLHFAAYRTAKWDGEVQTAAKLRAVHAAAAVATEWLADDDPFAYWPDPGDVLEGVAGFADPAERDVVDVIAGLVSAADRTNRPADDVDLRELRDRYVTRHFSAEAREAVIELSREHDEFVDVVPAKLPESFVLVGGAGSGKTHMLREFAYRSAMDVVRPEDGTTTRRLPRLIEARRILAGGADGLGVAREALVLGAVRLLVDGEDDVPPAERGHLFHRLAELHDRFPRTPLVIASRNQDRADRAGFEVVQLGAWAPRLSMRLLRGTRMLPVRDYSRLRRELNALGGATPGLLKMYLDVVESGRNTVRLAEVYHDYFNARLVGLDTSSLVEAAEASIDIGGPVPPPAGIDEFLARGVVRRDGEKVLFTQGIERDFFAASSLTQASEDVLRERARSFAWRPVSLMAALLPEVPDAVVDLVVRAVAGGDPRFAARLLALRPALPYCAEFVRTQSAILADRAQGRFASLSAVGALRVLGTPDALWRLTRWFTSRTVSPALICAALDVLTKPLPSTTADISLPADWLQDLLGRILDANGPRDVLLEAIRIVKIRRLPGLDPLLAALAGGVDHRVAQAADDALSYLHVVLPRSLRARRPVLVSERLEEVERTLPKLSVDDRIQAARAERLSLLERLDDLASLVPRLFSYGIRYEVADRIGDTLDVPVDLSAVRRLAQFDTGAANTLAYRILADHPRLRDELVFVADSSSRIAVLLIAAAAVRSPEAVGHASRLVEQLAEQDDGGRMEGLAALAHALVQADPAIGFRVSRDAARRLRERGIQARLCWPWITMLAHTRPGGDELDALLAQGEGRAIAEVAAACTALDGGPGDHVELGDAAHRFLLTDRSDEPAVRSLALCSAGLAEGLPEIVEYVSDRSLGESASTVLSGQYGLLELAPLAEILAAYGQLARQSENGDAARRILAGVDPVGLHPSVAAGKAIALGYLGDWIAVVEAAPGDGGRLDAAAKNTLRDWVPGPATPAHLREPGAIALWLKERLADAALSAGQRSLIQELVVEMETRHGALLPD
ncbi:hypothetical protein [Amycolatopsis solani]|uniref:hypothetical protein n=1 Tax=Amycolatopsis solani TaxID=3028615 RepID=UPI0025AF798F|nr:hypothetical protein [Amycolatopsis sp. MEP2-6]